MANGPDGLTISDSRSRISGAVAPPSGIRLPATSAHGKKDLNGRGQSGLPRPEYDTDQEWHLRNMRYGDGWAYDFTQSHYKRGKPTYTDPEDDRTTDSSLPIGSTSKTYDPRKDGRFWQRNDSGQDWSCYSSSSQQWRPRLRHERDFSSAAGDTSDASQTVHRLGRIHEADGDAMSASSNRTGRGC